MPVDPILARAREEAEGIEVFEDPFAASIVIAQREEAEGIETFEDPDAAIPVEALRQGAPGEESLIADLDDDVVEPPR